MKDSSAALAAAIRREVTNLSMCVKLTLIKHQPRIARILQSDPCEIQTLWAHGYSDGDNVRIMGVRGMTEINALIGVITVIDDFRFTIPIDSTGFSDYLGKGEARKVLGYTEFIHDLTIDGVLYRAGIGYMPRSIKAGSDLSVDNMEIIGLMPNKAKAEATHIILHGMSDEDVEVGRFDHARIELFYIDYRFPSGGRYILPGSGNIGQIKMLRGTHESEFRGKTLYLQEQIGDLYSKMCRAVLGDDVGDGSGQHDYKKPGFGCKVKLDPPEWRGAGDVAIIGIDTGQGEVTIAGQGPRTTNILITGSTGNDGLYTVTARSYDIGADTTTYTVEESLPDATVDGNLAAGGYYYTERPIGDAGKGSVVKPTVYNGRHFRCSASGVPGITEPDWDTGIGATTADGSAEWTAIQALTVFGTVTSVLNRRLFSDAGRTEPPTTGLGINTEIANYAIRAIGSNYFEIDGDVASYFPAGASFTVSGSNSNDGSYIITAAVASGARTRITTSTAIPDTTIVNGFVAGPLPAAAGFWTFGKLTFMTGANIGISKEVKDFTLTAYSAAAVDSGSQLFMIDGDVSALFAVDQHFIVTGSSGNDGDYDIVGVTYNAGSDQTEIEVAQAIPDTTADGVILAGPGQFELFERMPFDIEVGDAYVVSAGCDLAAQTCKLKFDNIKNLRAEVEIPGTDLSMLFPDTKI